MPFVEIFLLLKFHFSSRAQQMSSLSSSHSVNITFVLLDSSTGNPLSAADVLDILEETDARNRLNNTLYKTERFTAVTPSDGGSSTPR